MTCLYIVKRSFSTQNLVEKLYMRSLQPFPYHLDIFFHKVYCSCGWTAIGCDSIDDLMPFDVNFTMTTV